MAQLQIKPPLQSIYFIYGTEEYLIETIQKRIISLAITHEDQAFDMSKYNMEEQPVEVAIEDANTLPFMAEKRVVIIENAFFLTGDTKKRKVEHDMDRLAEYVQSPSPDTVLIIIAPYEKLDRRKKIVKSLEKQAEVFEFTSINDSMLYQILSDEAAQNGTEYTRQGHERLLEVSGTNASILVNEVKKMTLYAAGEQVIDRELVDRLAARTLESDVFQMVDKIMNRKPEEAFRLLADLIHQKEEPVKLLALITRQFRIALQTDLYQKQGFTQKQIASRLRLHPYAVKIASSQISRYGESALKKALTFCSDTDVSMKTGTMDKVVGLQILIQKLVSL
ncbi:DNA polymerase-3 subunit delta [Pullulanibacillus pueri]|uniref:DNA polymerase III subunit delta n=1 Tax=Pullulanibacillus pueri TaxID=1437324 RepID=A0A8J2ZXI5_9BACL|nr:DNA polymerase III subunit delta [Pullulanibacillus pueri]MBM7683067.1 DNA polymerase-3 subunit delta [Pullulanibacillus pueri]GGH84907.1 hypothetical protein GCM10007096_29060 [Pullulanibacillus pueri]